MGLRDGAQDGSLIALLVHSAGCHGFVRCHNKPAGCDWHSEYKWMLFLPTGPVFRHDQRLLSPVFTTPYWCFPYHLWLQMVGPNNVVRFRKTYYMEILGCKVSFNSPLFKNNADSTVIWSKTHSWVIHYFKDIVSWIAPRVKLLIRASLYPHLVVDRPEVRSRSLITHSVIFPGGWGSGLRPLECMMRSHFATIVQNLTECRKSHGLYFMMPAAQWTRR